MESSSFQLPPTTPPPEKKITRSRNVAVDNENQSTLLSY